MPTPIQRTVNRVLQDIKVSKVEEKQNERLKHIKEVVGTIGEDDAQNMLQELETQLERSGSWSLRGYLRLAYTKDPNHRLEFERKTWIQMAWLKGRNAETEIAVQTAGKILLQKIEDKNDLSETLKKYFLVEEFSSNRGQKVKIETMRSYIHDLNVYCKDKIRAKENGLQLLEKDGNEVKKTFQNHKDYLDLGTAPTPETKSHKYNDDLNLETLKKDQESSSKTLSEYRMEWAALEAEAKAKAKAKAKAEAEAKAKAEAEAKAKAEAEAKAKVKAKVTSILLEASSQMETSLSWLNLQFPEADSNSLPRKDESITSGFHVWIEKTIPTHEPTNKDLLSSPEKAQGAPSFDDLMKVHQETYRKIEAFQTSREQASVKLEDIMPAIKNVTEALDELCKVALQTKGENGALCKVALQTKGENLELPMESVDNMSAHSIAGPLICQSSLSDLFKEQTLAMDLLNKMSKKLIVIAEGSNIREEAEAKAEAEKKEKLQAEAEAEAKAEAEKKEKLQAEAEAEAEAEAKKKEKLQAEAEAEAEAKKPSSYLHRSISTNPHFQIVSSQVNSKNISIMRVQQEELFMKDEFTIQIPGDWSYQLPIEDNQLQIIELEKVLPKFPPNQNKMFLMPQSLVFVVETLDPVSRSAIHLMNVKEDAVDFLQQKSANSKIKFAALAGIAMKPTKKQLLHTLLIEQQSAKEDQMQRFINQEFARKLFEALQSLGKTSWVHGGISLETIFADPETGTIRIATPWEAKTIGNTVLYNANPERLKRNPTCYDHPALALGEGIGFEQDLYSVGITLIKASLMHTQGGVQKSEEFSDKLVKSFQEMRDAQPPKKYPELHGKILEIIHSYTVNNSEDSKKIMEFGMEIIRKSFPMDAENNHQPIIIQQEYYKILTETLSLLSDQRSDDEPDNL